MTVIYATKVFPSAQLELAASGAGRANLIQSELDHLARERGRLERAITAAQEGRLLPPIGERSYGDVIVIMVDSGEGENACDEIVAQLGQPTN